MYIDELRSTVGVGKADGVIDGGDMLKPTLACGELHCVSLTTLAEYRKYISHARPHS